MVRNIYWFHTSEMLKKRFQRSDNSSSKKTDYITVYSDEVRRWRNRNGNRSYFKDFDNTIAILERDENRVTQTTSDGYDHRYKACHKHFGKKLAVFYEYIGTDLHLLGVMKHFNDRNHWKPD